MTPSTVPGIASGGRRSRGASTRPCCNPSCSRIKVFRGNTLYADITNGHHRGGRAGVGSLNDSGRFDDFVITPLP